MCHYTDDDPAKLCPAPLHPDTLMLAERAAVATFAACHCRDYARVDVRLDEEGRPWVLQRGPGLRLTAGAILETAWARHLATTRELEPAGLLAG